MEKVKDICLKINANKKNGQFNISLPKKKLKKSNIDLSKFKTIKISIEGFE